MIQCVFDYWIIIRHHDKFHNKGNNKYYRKTQESEDGA